MRKFLIILYMLLFVSISFGQAFPFESVVTSGGIGADYLYDICVDNYGNKYITGKFNATIDFGNGVSITPIDNYDIYVAKYDENNVIQWANSFGGVSADEGGTVAVDESGNVIVTGSFFQSVILGADTLTSHGNFDVFIAKFDSDGNYLWMKHLHSDNQDKTYDMQIDNQGNYVLLGYYGDDAVDTLVYESLEVTSNGERDVFVIKMDSDGNPIWGVTGGGEDNDYPGGLVIDRYDNIYLNGHYDNVPATFGNTLLPNDNAGYEIFLAKLNSLGTYEWAVSANGPGDDKGYGIDFIDNGDSESGIVLIVGSFIDSIYAGSNNKLFESAGGQDMFVLAYSDAGDFLDGYSLGGEDDDEAKAINYIDGSIRDYYVSGISKSSIVLENETLTNNGARDILIYRMHQDSIVWAKNYGGSSDDYLNSAAIDNRGKISFAGNFKSTAIDFDSFPVTTSGNYDLWIGQMHEPYASVQLSCDMSVQINNGNFNISTDTLYVRGNFQIDAGDTQDWNGYMFKLTDPDENKIYELEIKLPADSIGKTYEYKFVMNDTWESVSNRTFDLQFPITWTETSLFNDEQEVVKTNIAISFQCNMELEIASERFNPANDTLSVRGSFNSWSDVTTMLPSATDPNIYEGSFNHDTFDGDILFYKFAYTTTTGTNWETNPPTGSGNYEHTISADDITNLYSIIPLRNYNNILPNTFVEQESVIRFIVDMNGAVDGNGIAFTTIENVVIAGGRPMLSWPSGGWPDADSNLVIFMVDDGTSGDVTAGDNIWTQKVYFPIYTPLDVEYKYGANWGLPSNGGTNDNEGGVGTNHHVTLFSEFVYGSAIDKFGTFEIKDIDTYVKETGEIPVVYALGQNYPNPFNPSTMIKFSLPESGLVSLKVFNLLGQEVATLINEFKNVGIYEISFDAAHLSTGIYIYRMQSGDFTATKKMLLIK